jgi:TolB-like protein/cytochrome c-type biogenesis protein CcmH/NrfG
VFLSYASQDAEAAHKICEALRGAGIEVFLDQSELRGGDAWDNKIRHEIHDCVLFIPIISQHTQERLEGYFRHEWKLATERAHHMAEEKSFLVPVVVDATRDQDAIVPDPFRAVHWTRLPGGVTQPEFVARIERLLSPEAPTAVRVPAGAASGSSPIPPTTGRLLPFRRTIPVAVAVLVLAVLAYLVINKLWMWKPAAPLSNATSSTASPAAFTPPPHSIAVLPFADMSEKRDQEYFSDGLAEDVLDLLAKVPELQVIARTSSFTFKGRSEDIRVIARTLDVAYLLQGSVRKAGNRLRVTTQLIRADTGTQLWSETYDRELKDVFKIQDEVANAVVAALKLRLSTEQHAADARRTANTDAYIQYLLGRQFSDRGADYKRAIDAYRNAIELDPSFAAAYAGIAVAEFLQANGESAGIERAKAAAQKAVSLGPELGEAYAARSFVRLHADLDFSGAQADIEAAMRLNPGNSLVRHRYAHLLADVGRLPEAITAERQAIELDPLSSAYWNNLGFFLAAAGQYPTAHQAMNRALQIAPTSLIVRGNLATLLLLEGRQQAALVAFRSLEDEASREFGIAVAAHSLGDSHASQQALDELVARHAADSAYQIARAFAWRGEVDKAFDWLERAREQRDSGLAVVKIDPTLNSLRRDPRYRAFLRKMNLPE